MFFTNLLMPFLKSNHIKLIWPHIKKNMLIIIQHDDIFIENALIFLNNSWPFKYPEKIIIYIDILETVINIIFKIDIFFKL
jgi:hypothetical protein